MGARYEDNKFKKKKKKEVINKREAGIKKKKTQKFVIFVKAKLKKNM